MKSSPASLLLLIALTLIYGCTKDQESSTLLDSLSDQGSEWENESGMCTELYTDDYSRAFGQKNLFWTKSKLRVRFLSGSTYVQNKVKQYAIQWSKHANITFDFVESEPSDIRISFNSNDGSWSYVGRTNAYITPSRATMNFGWFNERTSENEFRRTTLHEFGHALGLSHEHQHPEVSINWNKAAVYEYYQRTQGWSASEVNTNIFQKYSATSTNYSTYDPRSIMHYYIPKTLVTGTWNPTLNTNLSSSDIQFIGRIYPLNDPTETNNKTSCNCPEPENTLACEDFEKYSQATYQTSDDWRTWSTSAGYGELQTYTWGKVLKIAHSINLNPDILYTPGNLADGVYSVKWKMYVGAGNTAYFNIQKYEAAGKEFGAQIFFDKDKQARIEVNNRQATFDYEQDKWLGLELLFDFNTNLVTFKLDNQSISNWPANWSATSETGIPRFGALNFYAIDENAKFWLDDFCVNEVLSEQALASFDQEPTPGLNTLIQGLIKE